LFSLSLAKTIYRDLVIYTAPFIVARTLVYPVVNINNRLQRQYQKLEEEAEVKEKYQKYQNFTLAQKFKCAKDIIATSGFEGLYEKWESYIIPFTMARITEGFAYFICLRLCLDIFKMEDPLYLLTSIVFFITDIVGSFFLKFFMDAIKERKSVGESVAMVAPANKSFWKQYEVELGYYHTYGLIQGFSQLILYWYFQPGFYLQLVLFTFTRMLAAVNCQPLNLLTQWSIEHNYDHVKALQHIYKKDGRLALYAGVRDMLINEVIISVTLVCGFNFMSKLI